mmetsp:Transcript_83646/g.245260  ORF Transcript_83646/g.245260 Transcript_83646/m.245260 type:complete len:762 (-) Transcript_83646:30-2315(-)
MLPPHGVGEEALLDAFAEGESKEPAAVEDEGKSLGPEGSSSFQELLGLLRDEYDSIANQNARLQRENNFLQASLRMSISRQTTLAGAGPTSLLLPEGEELERRCEEPEAAGALLQNSAISPMKLASGDNLRMEPELSSALGIVVPEVLEIWQVKACDAVPLRRKAPRPSVLRDMEVAMHNGQVEDSNAGSRPRLTTTPSLFISTMMAYRTSVGWSCDRLILPPESRVRMLWDALGIFFLMFDVMHTPLMVFREPDSDFEFAMEVLTTLFWTTDIGLSFFRGYYRNCVVEMRPRMIAKRYFKREFAPDFIICSLDWSMMILQQGYSSAVNYSRLSKTVRVIRIARIVRLMRLMKMPAFIESLTGKLSESGTSVSIVVKSLLLIMGTNHFIACGWYAMGSVSEPAWIDQLNEENRDFLYRYSTSLHWSITQFTPASMEVQPKNPFERIFAICTIILGLVMFSSFVSTITSTMTTLRVERQRRSTQNENIRRYLAENDISVAVGSRIAAFLNAYNITARRCVARKDITLFKALPKNLRLMIDWEVYQPILDKSAFFNHCSDTDAAGMLDICHNVMEEVTIATCEELFHCGAHSIAMYITLSGAMQYFEGFDEGSPKDIDGRTHTRISEPALWLAWIHQGRVFALTACDFLRISAERLTKALVNYPELLFAGQEYARLFKARIHELRLEMEQDVPEEEEEEGMPSGQAREPRCTVASDLFTLEHGAALELAQLAFDFAGAATSNSRSSVRSKTGNMVKQKGRLSL